MNRKTAAVMVCIMFSVLLFMSLKEFLIPESVKTTLNARILKPNGRVLADGTFIQWWLVKNWDNHRWMKEFEMLKDAGMNYVVLMPTAVCVSNENSEEGFTHTIYPTKIEGFQMFLSENGEESYDIVDACLRNAEKVGLKVFLGLNFSHDWWQKRLDAEWVYARMEEGNKVADELWENYYSKYPDTFYGWYWAWEVDNFYFTTTDLFKTTRNMLTKAIKIHMDHFDENDMRLPFMLSPYMDWRLGRPETYAKMWKYVFGHSGMKEGDIFCPQDSVGTKGLALDDIERWFSEFRKAVDSKPGLELWANVETFDDVNWTSAVINRFVDQMNRVSRYVDNAITFSYSHYYSPFNTNPGFHNTYMEYVREGKIETSAPTVPTELSAFYRSRNTIHLTWKSSQDNVGVCGYYIFRNGKMIANVQMQDVERFKAVKLNINDTVSGERIRAEQFTDANAEPGKVYHYEVQAYDFAGNVSPKASLPGVVAKD